MLGWAIHAIPDDEYSLIVKTGLEGNLFNEVFDDKVLTEQERLMTSVPKKVRDRAFFKNSQKSLQLEVCLYRLKDINYRLQS